MKLILSPRAELDFEAQVRWLQLHSPVAGREAALGIVHTIDLLADFPDLGMVVRGAVREKAVQFGRDGFVIRYRRSGQTLICAPHLSQPPEPTTVISRTGSRHLGGRNSEN